MNVTLIGMPGSGKSVVGVLLAKRMNLGFVDGDLVIQQNQGELLKDILSEKGFDEFERIENAANLSITQPDTVIAPGGSIIYCPEAMEHFKKMGPVVYLKISLEELTKRLGNLTERGVALHAGQTLKDLYEERVPLYESYADLSVDEDGLTVGETMQAVFNALAASKVFTKEEFMV